MAITNTTDANDVTKEQKQESQKKNLRLQIVLLFYDHMDWEKLQIDDDENFICAQESKELARCPFKIEGVEQAEDEIIEQYLFPIKETLKIKKGKKCTEITVFQNKIIDKIKSRKETYVNSDIDKIYLDILYPTDNIIMGPKDVYLTSLFDNGYAERLKRYVDVKNITVSVLYPSEENGEKSSNENSSLSYKPSKLDAKIAALMSHYVYFYLDWLEYVRVHVNNLHIGHKLEKYKNSSNDFSDIIKEFNNLKSPFAWQLLSIGAGKVKARVIGRLKEIAKIVGYAKINYSDIEGTINQYQYNSGKVSKENTINSKENTIKEIIEKVSNDDEVKANLSQYFYGEILEELDNLKKTTIIIDLLETLKKIITGIYECINKSRGKIEKIQKQIEELCNNYDGVWIQPIKTIFTSIERKLYNARKFNTEFYSQNVESIKKQIEELIQNLKSNKYEKDKFAFVNFLHEISAISVYGKILLDCKQSGRPIGFYDLYDRFGYWTYLNDKDLEEEAKTWYVSHPYFVFKNDYERIYGNDNICKNTGDGINDDSTKAYDKFLFVPRKSQRIFIYKNKYQYENNEWSAKEGDYLIYNTVLTHGMDQASGYGGLLFTKIAVDKDMKKIEPLKFAYCIKGTDCNSFNDWVLADILQGVSGFSLQHLHNVKNAITINKKVKESYSTCPLFFCGHSLGGGLASACAIASKGRHAITFNAAGLNFLGVIATRTIGGYNYGKDVPKKVHPIRIDGEFVDFVMVITFFLLAHLNERAYGEPELILKLNTENIEFLKLKTNIAKWDLSETGAKHGINNFLYKPLMDALEIVEKRTIKCPAENRVFKNTSISTLGVDKFKLVTPYTLTFSTNDTSITFKSCLNCNYEDMKKMLFSDINLQKNI